MSPDALAGWWKRRGRWEQIALLLWLTATLVIVVRVAVAPPTCRTVYPIFKSAGESWLAGDGLYSLPNGPSNKLLYRYSPLVAALLVPFSIVPDPLGAILWRLVNESVLLLAFGYWVRAVLPRPVSAAQGGLLFLLLIPLSVANLNNGQANVLVIGLLLASTAAVAEERWSLAAAAVALASFVKIYPLALGLLLAVVAPRRFLCWLVAWLLLAALLPFALQRPDYVLAQYRDWVHYLHLDDRSGWDPMGGYRDLRLVLTVWVMRPSAAVYLALQLAGAACCGLLCLVMRFGAWPRRRLLTMLLGLATGWMTLLGPSTESCTYILLAPSLAWLVVEAVRERRPAVVHVFLWLGVALFTVARLGSWIPGGVANQIHALGVHPLAGLMAVAGLLANEYSWFALSRNEAEAPSLLPAPRVA